VSTDERVAQLESAFVTLTRLVQNHGERFDTHMTWINELGETTARLNASVAGLSERMEELAAAQANGEGKIAALVDAQIHTEDALRQLAAQMARTDARIDRLVEQGAQANVRLDRLAAMVERLMEGRNGQG
jgi:chromosome segregation ATPase